MMWEIIRGQVISKANNYQCVTRKNGTSQIIKNDKIRSYERLFEKQCKVYKDRMIATPFRLVYHVYFPSIKNDIDNAAKTLMDCLQYNHCITDDNLRFEIQAFKHIDATNPRIEFAIEEFNEQKKLF